MCAISGINESNEAIIRDMNARMAHRGPDDTGVFSDGRITLGHNRLSILDLSPQGHQPMGRGGLEIVFNGEIYNFKELKSELEAAGERFASKSDTEVILAGYGREGESFFKKLRGMWAFALYDSQAGKIVLSRDPFGIKPLYVYLKNGRFAFSSELTGLAPVLKKYGATDDPLAHRLYFMFGYIPAPLSPYAEVQKIMPGALMSFDLALHTLRAHESVPPYMETAPADIEASLDDAIRAHFVSDVPVGVFYSGGTDSTLILAKSRELGFSPEAFFLRVPGRIDNEYALRAAEELGVTPKVFDFDEKTARDALERALGALDEPFADSSYIPTEYLSSQVASTHKVILSGEGGDEFFGGYHRHNHLLGLGSGMRLVPEGIVRLFPLRMRRFIESKINRDRYAAYLEFVRLDEGMGPRHEALRFLKEQNSRGHDVPGLSIDQTVYLPDDLLFKIDRAGMRHGLEGRVPFLDRRFFATVRALPAERRHGGGKTGKAALKAILRKYLPHALVERPKQGFSMPLALVKQIPDETFLRAAAEAAAHPELVPLPRALIQHLAGDETARADFRDAHPQAAYLLLMWGGWRTNAARQI